MSKPAAHYAQVTKRLASRDHERVEAQLWAIGTLRKAGLPSEPGCYTPNGRGGLRPLSGADEGTVAWGALSPSIEDMGYAKGSPEVVAATLVEALSRAGYWIQQGDAQAAADEAFRAGMIWQARLQDDDKELGLRVRRGGRTGAQGQADDDAHMAWLLEDNRLMREEPYLAASERARRIAQRFGGNPETIRKRVREMRGKNR